jgi:hypothetical protein
MSFSAANAMCQIHRPRRVNAVHDLLSHRGQELTRATRIQEVIDRLSQGSDNTRGLLAFNV